MRIAQGCRWEGLKGKKAEHCQVTRIPKNLEPKNLTRAEGLVCFSSFARYLPT